MPTASLRFLGTGTSHGVPSIGCRCAVCRSDDPANKRLRTSAYVEVSGARLLIDASIDLRQQALRYGVERIDAILLTHAHSDHYFGLDEIRIFNHMQSGPIPCYGNRECLDRVRHVFDFVFGAPPPGGGISSLTLVEMPPRALVAEVCVEAIPLLHGPLPILGYRIGPLAYCTDCSAVPPPSFERLRGLDVLVLDCLRHRPHPTHMHLEEAVRTARAIGARRTYFVHMCHDLDHAETNAALPPGMQLARDGEVVEWEIDAG